MTGDPVTFGDVTPPDDDAARAALTRLAGVAVPAGAGATVRTPEPAVARVAGWLAARGSSASDCRLVIFAGDNGVVTDGPRDGGRVTLLPEGFSSDAADAVGDGSAPVVALAHRVDAALRLVDTNLHRGPAVTGAAADGPSDGDRDRWRVRDSSGAVDREDAMSDDELEAALRGGRDVADREIDGGADLLLTGEIGAGLTTVAATVVCAVCRAEPVRAVGPGAGVDDTTWRSKVAVIRDALFRVRRHRDSPRALLRSVTSPAVAAEAAFIAHAAERRTPVVLDGVASAAAAVVADLLCPGARSWCLPAHAAAEPAHRIAMTHLGAEPVVPGDLGLSQGAAALQVLPVLRTACALAAGPESDGDGDRPAEPDGAADRSANRGGGGDPAHH